MKLTSENVKVIFMDSIFKEKEDTSNSIKAEGIICTAGFHPDRLKSHKEEVESMLHELHDNFQANSGGGWSFLNACYDKHGHQWTDMHQRIEQLFQLGIGLGLAKWQAPREMWEIFPGGMPYVVVN